MIVNELTKQDNTRLSHNDYDNPTVMDIHNSEIPFYLTGSKYFGHSHKNSDFNFFLEAEPEYSFGPVIRHTNRSRWFSDHKFEYESKTGPTAFGFMNCTEVLLHKENNVRIYFQKNIHVTLFIQAWIDQIRTTYIMKDKEERTRIWDWGWQIFHTFALNPILTMELVNSGTIKAGGIYLPNI